MRSKNLDKLDVKIIAALHRAGRMTKLQLSEEVGLSPTPCWERIKKLEKAGYIKSYHAEVDLKKLLGVSYFRVELMIPAYYAATFTKLEKAICDTPEVIECEAILGSIDYVLKVAARNVEEYQKVIDGILKVVETEIDYRTYPVSKVVKEAKDFDLLAACEAFSAPT